MKICAIGLRGIPDVMGGIETHCEHLYTRLASLDDTLEIIVIGRSGYVKSGKIDNIRVVTLWAPRWSMLETLIHTPLAILYARLFLHPDVVHLHAIGPGFFAPLARLLGFRVIGTHHAADYERPKWGRLGSWFLKTGERMLTMFADEVICVSNQIEKRLSNEYPKARNRFVTIRNGAPPVVSSDKSAEELLESLGVERGRYILCVGRIDPSKGFHDAIAAYDMVKPKGMKLVLVGGSIGSDQYAAQLKETTPAGCVFAGQRPAGEVRTLYENAALFLHPSYLEGFAIVVLEALSADIPILVTDIPPHREVGLDGASYYACGDVEHLASILAEGNYGRMRCSRRVEILDENNWDRAARRYRDILVTRVRGRRADEIAAPAP
jgi:glycosyltransferase involved in cell wall biosynthesis